MSLTTQYITPTHFNLLKNNIIQNLYESKDYYPYFELWLHKVQKEIKDNTRICYGVFEGNDIVGFSIIKNTLSKSKICTLWVHNDLRGNGIGSFLLHQALSACHFSPIITIPHYAFLPVYKCIQKYQPELLLEIKNRYVQGENEYIYKINKTYYNCYCYRYVTYNFEHS